MSFDKVYTFNVFGQHVSFDSPNYPMFQTQIYKYGLDEMGKSVLIIDGDSDVHNIGQIIDKKMIGQFLRFMEDRHGRIIVWAGWRMTMALFLGQYHITIPAGINLNHLQKAFRVLAFYEVEAPPVDH